MGIERRAPSAIACCNRRCASAVLEVSCWATPAFRVVASDYAGTPPLHKRGDGAFRRAIGRQPGFANKRRASCEECSPHQFVSKETICCGDDALPLQLILARFLLRSRCAG